MSYSKLMLAVVLGALGIHTAGATPTPEEAAQLGKTLTPMGAIKAGNKEGTIPEWTGGLCTPPPGYKPHYGLAAGGGPYSYPWDDEKPLFKITSADLPKYADKLDESTRELLRRYPQTFYLNVYPTHRSACFPNWVYENTIKNVMKPRIVGGNVPSVTGAHAQVPFPIPKTGVEVLWNNMLTYDTDRLWLESATYFVDASGHRSVIDHSLLHEHLAYWDNKNPLGEDQPASRIVAKTLYPPGQAGTVMLLYSYLRMDLKGTPAWSYIPGQRRVRMAPDFAYDGVLTSLGGLQLYDEINGWAGKMDRFDFKLLGRKEMYVMYNAKPSLVGRAEFDTRNHVDPAAHRWELHRVWVVEATLKPGERHVQKRKIFYIDEDTWRTTTYVGIDHADKPHHAFYMYLAQQYDKPALDFLGYLGFDFAKRIYMNLAFFGPGPGPGHEMFGIMTDTSPYSSNAYSPEGVAGSGVR